MATIDPPTYSPAERDRRWNLARSFMDNEELDGLIVYGEHEDAGAAAIVFDTWFTNDRPGSTVVFPRQGEPIELVPFSHSIIDHIESSRRGDATWTAPENMRLGRDADALASVLTETGLSEKRIGVVGLGTYIPFHATGVIPYSLWSKILSQFPNATFKEVDDSFARLVRRLGDEELAVLRHTARIGDSMAQAMVKTARSGIYESDVFAAGMAASNICGTVTPCIHFYSSPEPLVLGIPQWAYRPQAPRVLQSGDLIMTEIFCNFGMRQVQQQVMIAIGNVPEDFVRAASVARACYETGLRALKPGVKFGDVCNEMLQVVKDAGGWNIGPQIHGLNPLVAVCGSSSPQLGDTNGYVEIEGFPTAGGEIVLESGMSFAFEPSCGFGRHLVKIGGTVVLQEDGPVELNPYTAQLHRVSA